MDGFSYSLMLMSLVGNLEKGCFIVPGGCKMIHIKCLIDKVGSLFSDFLRTHISQKIRVYTVVWR